MSDKKEETLPQIDPLSDDDFKEYLLNIIKATARENVNGRDQIEGLLIAQISCAIAQGVQPSELLMFLAQGIVAFSSKLNSLAKSVESGEPSDIKNLLRKIPGNFKN
jgi:2-keto-3-deoxy-6-phosphogluconate aldolase